MENLLKQLQSETDALRSKLRIKAKFNQFDQEFEEISNLLKTKDKKLFNLAKQNNVSINKFGRLSL